MPDNSAAVARAQYEQRAAVASSRSTVGELASAYLSYARTYYPSRQGSSEVTNIRDALRALWLYSDTPAADFGSAQLQACRAWMVDQDYARSTCNKRASRIVRMFKWAAAQEILPASVAATLSMVPPLKEGRTTARETLPVMPVPESHILRAMQHASEGARALVQMQLETGMRPGEAVIMRGCDIDTDNEPWEYAPMTHKNKWRGLPRRVYLSRGAASLAARYMSPGFMFRTCRGRPFTVNHYGVVIREACDKAGIPRWSPGRLRHTAAARFREELGLEATRVLLGHTSADTTTRYARDENAARAAVLRLD